MFQRKKIVSFHFLPGVFLLIIISYGCIDNDIRNMEGNVLFSPEYSIPVGSDSVTMEEAIEGYPYDLILIPDTTNLPDSISVFLYDSLSYYNPLYFDYSQESYYDLGQLSNKIDFITSLMLRLNCINGFPSRVELQVYFLNQDNAELDSAFSDGPLAIQAASVNSDGQVTEKFELYEHDVYLDEHFIDILSQTTHIRVISRIELVNFSLQNVKYFRDNDFWLQLGLRAKLEIPIDEVY